jgi:CBS domain-containing protein
MTPHVLRAQADWPIERLAEFLIENDISGAPVISEYGTLIGVVSLTDIVRHDSLHQRQRNGERPHPYYLPALENQYAPEELETFRIEGGSETTVREIMTPMIFQVDGETPVAEVADKMIRGRIHRVFVTQNDRVVGIITALGLLDVLRQS